MGRAEKEQGGGEKKIAARVSGDRDQAAHYCTPENHENHVVAVIATKITHPNMLVHTNTHKISHHLSLSIGVFE